MFRMFIQGPSFESIRSIAVSQITVPLEESPRIRVDVDDDEDEWTEVAIAFISKRNSTSLQEYALAHVASLQLMLEEHAVSFSFLFCAI